MAYMHESVHICHVDVRFFMLTPFSASYPGNFVFGSKDCLYLWRVQMILTIENAPEGEKRKKKILKKILKIIFLRIKKFWKNFY